MSSPGQRAAAELTADPCRTDAAVALASGSTTRTVQRARRVLERRGVIEPAPFRRRPWPTDGRNPGAALRVAAELATDPDRSTRSLAQAALCSDSTVLAARRAASAPAREDTGPMRRRTAPRLRAAPDDHHAPAGVTDPLTRPVPRFGYEPDPDLEQWLCCTAEWRDGRFTHERSCLFRQSG